VLADEGSIPSASTSIQKQRPAGENRRAVVFEYFVAAEGIGHSSGTDVGRSRYFAPHRGAPA
jgi:hypothetical protein